MEKINMNFYTKYNKQPPIVIKSNNFQLSNKVRFNGSKTLSGMITIVKNSSSGCKSCGK